MKRLSFCILLLITSTTLIAQFTLNRKKSCFGISLDYNLSIPQIELSNEFVPTFGGTIISANPEVKAGFGLGILYQYRLNEKLGLISRANITFAETQVEFELDGTIDVNFPRKHEHVFVELPIGILYEDLSKKIGPTFMLGGKFGYDLAKESNDPSIPISEQSNLQFALEAGAGIAFAFEKFAFRPELIYSKGLSQQERYLGIPTESISSNNLDQIAVRLSFYGL